MLFQHLETSYFMQEKSQLGELTLGNSLLHIGGNPAKVWPIHIGEKPAFGIHIGEKPACEIHIGESLLGELTLGKSLLGYGQFTLDNSIIAMHCLDGETYH